MRPKSVRSKNKKIRFSIIAYNQQMNKKN